MKMTFWEYVNTLNTLRQTPVMVSHLDNYWNHRCTIKTVTLKFRVHEKALTCT